MQRIRQEMPGYRMPAYVEEILTHNYCPGFMRMTIIRESGSYRFSYKPGCFEKLCPEKLTLYDKLILLRSIIVMSESAGDHLIEPEAYLLEPELVYVRGARADPGNIRLMYYPDMKKLDFRFKIVIFADRILSRSIREEREMAERIRETAETGDINRIKLFLDKSIIRMEKRMNEGQSLRNMRS